jgi:hypothetical protein
VRQPGWRATSPGGGTHPGTRYQPLAGRGVSAESFAVPCVVSKLEWFPDANGSGISDMGLGSVSFWQATGDVEETGLPIFCFNRKDVRRWTVSPSKGLIMLLPPLKNEISSARPYVMPPHTYI